MEENGNKKPPVRKLTVKNFSVIKEAELEFGKITVLIGPQASGKSLLCKLAYFLGKELVDSAVSSILAGNSWTYFLQDAAGAFLNRFPFGGDSVSSLAQIQYVSHLYQVSVGWDDEHHLPKFSFAVAFSEQYDALLKDISASIPAASGAFIPGGISSIARREDVWIALHKVLSDGTIDGAFYIPAGRAFFTNLWKGNAVLQNAGIDPITRDFSGQILWGGNWKNGLLTTGRGITDEIDRQMTDILQGFVILDSGVPRFLASDGRKIPLEALSSGTQEMIPLFDVLEQLMYFREHTFETARASRHSPREAELVSSRPFLYLEEPETNVFPTTQYALVQLFAWLCSDPILAFRWVITTHSPYILTAFNSLIMAGQLAAEKPELRSNVAKLVPEHFWIENGSFRAYSIHDGKLESILSESGLIDGEYLDSVSDTIEKEFDSLLRLEYDHTEAS